MNARLKLVGDENIPRLKESIHALFGDTATLRVCPGRSINQAMVRDADILLLRSVTRVDADLLRGSSVKFIGSCTIGTDHVQLDQLLDLGIHFAHAPGCNANSVVQYVLACLSFAALHSNALGDDEEPFRLTTGIIGCGQVGGRLAACLQHCGAEVRVYDPWLDSIADSPGYQLYCHAHGTEFDPAASGLQLSSLDEVLQSRIVSLHAPMIHSGAHSTHHLLNTETVNRLRSGTIVLNTARGGLIDNQALLARMQRDNDLFPVLDVWEHEPFINAELALKCLLATPHIAGYSLEGKQQSLLQVLAALADYLQLSQGTNLLTGMAAVEHLMTDKSPDQRADSAAINRLTARLRQDDAPTQRSVCELILQHYNPGWDHRQMLQLCLDPEHNRLAEGFDRLRKCYPCRREWQAGKGLQASLLKALGF